MNAKQLKQQILNADDSKPTPVDISEWGISAFIKPLDGDDRFALAQLALSKSKENTYITEAYVCLGLVDENGDQIFSFDDRALLAKKNPLVIERLFKKVISASGIDEADQADLEKK